MNEKNDYKKEVKDARAGSSGKGSERASISETRGNNPSESTGTKKAAWNLAILWFGIPLVIVVVLAFLLRD